MFRQPMGFWAIVLLLIDIWALIHIVQSSASPGRKAIWIVLILLLPAFGFLLWLFFGPRSRRN